MKFTKKRIGLIALVIAVLVVIAFLPKNRQQAPEETAATYTVRTQKITRQDLQE